MDEFSILARSINYLTHVYPAIKAPNSFTDDLFLAHDLLLKLIDNGGDFQKFIVMAKTVIEQYNCLATTAIIPLHSGDDLTQWLQILPDVNIFITECETKSIQLYKDLKQTEISLKKYISKRNKIFNRYIPPEAVEEMDWDTFIIWCSETSNVKKLLHEDRHRRDVIQVSEKLKLTVIPIIMTDFVWLCDINNRIWKQPAIWFPNEMEFTGGDKQIYITLIDTCLARHPDPSDSDRRYRGEKV